MRNHTHLQVGPHWTLTKRSENVPTSASLVAWAWQRGTAVSASRAQNPPRLLSSTEQTPQHVGARAKTTVALRAPVGAIAVRGRNPKNHRPPGGGGCATHWVQSTAVGGQEPKAYTRKTEIMGLI